MEDLFEKCSQDGGYLPEYRKRKDRYFVQPILDGAPATRMVFAGKPVIMWSLNNYLGLAERNELKEVAAKSVQEFGPGAPMGSRMLTGNTSHHIQLEKEFSQFFGKEDSILFNVGYLGMLGSVIPLIGVNDQIIVDQDVHACVHDAARLALAGRRLRIFKHNSPEDLEKQLRLANSNRKGGVLVLVEGVYGMRGDMAPLREICDLKEKYGARLLVDDAHGVGLMGARGRGAAEHFDVMDRVDLIYTAFTKSFAAIGSVTSGPDAVINYIRFNAHTNIFTKSLPLVQVFTVKEGLRILQSEPELREKVLRVSQSLQKGLVDLGYTIGKTQTPLTPVFIHSGDEKRGTEMVKAMREDFGIFVSAISYPVVSRGTLLLRMVPTASHTLEDVQITLEAFRKLKERFGLGSTPTNE